MVKKDGPTEQTEYKEYSKEELFKVGMPKSGKPWKKNVQRYEEILQNQLLKKQQLIFTKSICDSCNEIGLLSCMINAYFRNVLLIYIGWFVYRVSNRVMASRTNKGAILSFDQKVQRSADRKELKEKMDSLKKEFEETVNKSCIFMIRKEIFCFVYT